VTAGSRQLIIGTYTERLPFVHGKAPGILACDYEDGRLSPPTLLATARNPSWVTISASGRNVYAIHETAEFDGQPTGGVTAYARDPSTGELIVLNGASSLGQAPAHVALIGPESLLLLANYESGSVACYSLDEQGGLARLTGFSQHTGSSADPVRQTGPHAHMVYPDPVTGRVLVPDLGLDAVLSYEVSEAGQLIERSAERIAVTPGYGPRHLAFHPGGDYMFLLNEMASTLIALRRGPSGFVITDSQSTLPASCTSHSEAAAVRVDATGRFIYASNRGYDTIAMFALDQASGTLTLVHLASTMGREPRDFCLSPDGQYLLVANQDSDSIVSFEVNENGPTLSQAFEVPVPSPACLLFAPERSSSP
jgi:6-phosphogluconolactonase